MAGALQWDEVLAELGGTTKPQTAAVNVYPTSASTAPGMGESYSTEGWTYLGPNNFGGPTSAIAIDSSNPDIVYALSQMGALFKSTNGSAHWGFIYQLPLQHAKLEVSATQPGTLYAYTNFAKDLANAPSGIHKSADGGLTWSQIEFSNGSDIEVRDLDEINRIRTMPGQPGVLFAAGNVGLLRSPDGGVTWYAIADSSNQVFSDCTELEIAPAKNKLYAVCAKQPVVFQPDGSGATRLFEADLADSSDQLKIAVAKSNQDVIYLAATKASQGHSRLITRIYRSTDAGATWETRFRRAMPGETPTPQSSDPFNIALPGYFERDCASPSPYNYFEDYQLAVDPSDANSLWVAGGQTYRSDDAGQTFGRAGVDVESAKASLVFAPGYNGVGNQVVFVAGPDGIRRTANARAALQTYPTVTCSNAYLAAAPAVSWTAPHDGYSAAMLLGGSTFKYHDFAASLWTPSLYSRGTYLANAQSPDSWSELYGAAGAHVLISQSNQLNQLFITAANSLYRYRKSGGGWGTNIFFPEMPAPVWISGYVFPVRKSQIGFFESLNAYRLTPHPANPSVLVTPTDGGMYASTDAGATWQLRGPAAQMYAATIKRDGGLLGAIYDGGFVSENPVGSGNWEKRNLAGCLMTEDNQCDYQEANIQDFVLSPVPGSQAIYAIGNTPDKPKVHYSTDGRTWTALDRPGQPGGLPEYLGMTTLAVDPNNPSHLYVGTSFGLYASVDHGQTWSAMATPFPLTAVSKLSFERDADGNRRLFVFTYGRGAWAYQVPQSTTFADVPTYHWAYDYEQRLFNAGITTGCATNPLRYCPEQRVLREQMAVFLLRAKHGSSYQPPAATGIFADVPANHWASAWIEQLGVEGITQGCATSPARYCPGNEVQRDQMAVFLLRAKYGAAYQPPAATGVFEDVPVSYWAAPWIEQLAREGVTSGCSATPKLYCPASPISRDQMAVFLVRAFGL